MKVKIQLTATLFCSNKIIADTTYFELERAAQLEQALMVHWVFCKSKVKRMDVLTVNTSYAGQDSTSNTELRGAIDHHIHDTLKDELEGTDKSVFAGSFGEANVMGHLSVELLCTFWCREK